MKCILITPPYFHTNEIEILKFAFDCRFDKIHIRKPNKNEVVLNSYLSKIPDKIIQKSSLHYYKNVIHQYNFSGFHLDTKTINNILNDKNFETEIKSKQYSASFHFQEKIQEKIKGLNIQYAFCSPVFSSISKENYKPSFEWNIQQSYKDLELIALGGIDHTKIEECKNRGFNGVAILGAVWNKKKWSEMKKELIKIKKECDRLS